MNKKWFRDVPVLDAQDAQRWLEFLCDENNANYDKKLVDYIGKMCLGDEAYDRSMHNVLAEVFDVGCPIPRDEGFFQELYWLIEWYTNCAYESTEESGAVKFIYAAQKINHLYSILQEYIDDWNMCGCDRCPLDM